MANNNDIQELRDHLNAMPAGAPVDENIVGGLLIGCWNALDGGNDTKMRPEKLTRIEQLSWNPPFLDFSIERHGKTVHGSTRASLYRWRVDVEKGSAYIIDEMTRQLSAIDKPLNVKPIAEKLTDVILHEKHDPHVTFSKDGTVKLKMTEIIPATNNQTTTARRRRLRQHLSMLLASHGWKELRPNVYYRPNG
jgi:hypothetical protein